MPAPTRRSTGRRSLLTAALTVVATVAATVAATVGVGVVGAGPADATAYRFWSYWLGDSDGWAFAAQGGARRPADGTVDGWRFAISEATTSSTPPRRAPSFTQLCGATAAVDGRKRVGLVVDFGTAADAPSGESPPPLLARCLVVPEDANGYDVLAAAVSLRTQSGLICGLNGYPATECGAPVADPSPSPSRNGGGTGGGADSGDGGGGSNGGGSDATEPGGSAGTSTNGQGAGQPGSDQPGSGKQDAGQDGTSPPDAGKGKQADASRADAASSPDAASPVAAPVSDPSASSSTTGSPTGVLVGVALIAALGIATLAVRRSRR